MDTETPFVGTHACNSCPKRGLGRMVCRCLQVTEEVLLEALATSDDIQTLKDIRQHTGAGDGCTACHRLLRKYLERKMALPVVQSA